MPQSSSSRKFGLSLAAVSGLAAALSLASPAAADLSGTVWASEPFIVVNASSGLGSGTISIPLNPINLPGGTQTQDLGDSYYIYYNSVAPQAIGAVATLVQMNVYTGIAQQMDGNYRWFISMDFVVKAGAQDTSFELMSPVIGFGPLANILDATTSATLGGTDTSGDNTGLTITPMGGGGTWGFASLINANSLPNNYSDVNSALAGSTLYRHYFHGLITAIPGDSNGEAGNMADFPVGNPFLASVNTMQSMFSFKVSANDEAGGSSDFSVPAPASAMLVGLGGLFAARRRR